MGIYSSKFPRSFIQKPLQYSFSTQISRQTILKIYQPNITIEHGEKLHLNCPYTSDNIKTIIWTKELRPPRIIANNNELYSKNLKYSLVIGNYSLQICPVEPRDSGWYSCYVVKKTLYEQNVKYFVYVDVLGSDDVENDDFDYLDDSLPEKCKSMHTTTPDPKELSLKRQLGTIVDEKIFNLAISTTNKQDENELEDLQVTPRFLEVNESNSFQLQCVYSGPNYLNVTLKWLKNDNELRENKRFVFVDYTTNRSVLKIVKFSFAVESDSGQYKCYGYINSKEIFSQKIEKIVSIINVNCKYYRKNLI